MRQPLRTLLAWLTMAAVLPLTAADVVGTLSVVDHRGRPENLEDGTAIIYLHGLAADIPQSLQSIDYIMGMEDKQFTPRIMVVPKGATVQFPNLDPIIHNVFSVSGANKFDGGSYSRGEGVSHTFQNDGLVRIFCNVHHRMNAIIFVTENPFFATLQSDGSFTIKNVPPGNYELRILHESGSRSREKITVTSENLTVAPKLELLKPRPLRHLNKEGKPYKNRRSRRY